MPWTLDAEVESTPLSTTGGHTWEAARRLAAYLSAAAGQLGLQQPGLRVLELGSGTGWLGVNVARNMPAAELVVLTEQPDGLAHLRRNVALNAAQGLPVGHVRVQSCDWRAYGPEAASDGGGSDATAAGVDGSAAVRSGGQDSTQHTAHAAAQPAPAGAGEPAAAAPADEQWGEDEFYLAAVPWDFILGSDLIYNDIGSRCLPCVLAALARPHTQVRNCRCACCARWLQQRGVCGCARHACQVANGYSVLAVCNRFAGWQQPALLVPP